MSSFTMGILVVCFYLDDVFRLLFDSKMDTTSMILYEEKDKWSRYCMKKKTSDLLVLEVWFVKLHFLEHFHLCFRDQVKSLSYMILSQSLAEVTTILQYVVENFSFYSISVYKNCCHETVSRVHASLNLIRSRGSQV